MDLTQIEQDVLRCLTESRTTASVVTLAADLWRTTPDWQAEDVMPLITWVLEGLNQKGLLTYREQHIVNVVPRSESETHDVRYLSATMPVQIRLSPTGWAQQGYPTTHGHVGHGSRHSRDNVKHTGDMTNYRNLPDRAPGDAIVVEDFPTHKANFPQHVHMYYDVAEGDIHMNTRAYNRVTPEIEAAVIFTRNELGTGATMADIATATGLPERQVRYVLTDLPRLRRMQDEDGEGMSLKQRIVMTLTELPEVDDATELVRILGRADTMHDVVHVLHSLHTQGKVDFKESANAKQPTHIHLVKRGRNGVKKTNGVESPAPTAVQAPEAGPSPVSVQPEPESVQGYPLLDALLDRERERQSQDHKGYAYVTAAEAIQDIDPETARDLMAKAEALSVPFPSPIEQEYLLYVAEHPSTKD